MTYSENLSSYASGYSSGFIAALCIRLAAIWCIVLHRFQRMKDTGIRCHARLLFALQRIALRAACIRSQPSLPIRLFVRQLMGFCSFGNCIAFQSAGALIK